MIETKPKKPTMVRLDYDAWEKLQTMSKQYPHAKGHLVSKAIALLWEREQHVNDNVSLVR